MNPLEITEEHKSLLDDARKGFGEEWRKFLIGIDGRDHAGKSTIGRYLALKMHITAIETDLFMKEWGVYHDEDLKRVIDARLNKDRPVIVEGIFLLRTLDNLGLEPNYLIYAVNEGFEGSETKRADFIAYEAKYAPKRKAKNVFYWKGE